MYGVSVRVAEYVIGVFVEVAGRYQMGRVSLFLHTIPISVTGVISKGIPFVYTLSRLCALMYPPEPLSVDCQIEFIVVLCAD